jgi:hypothetical protein
MGTVIAVLKQFNNIRKKANITNRALSDPSSIGQMIIEKIIAMIKGLIIGVIVDFGWLFLIIIVVVGGLSSLFSSFKTFNGDTYDSYNELSYEKNIGEWADNLSSEELADFEKLGIPINSKHVKEYLKIEDKSYEKYVDTTMTVKVVSNKGGSSTTQKPYQLELTQASKPYRLWWQLLMGVDSLYDKDETGWAKIDILNKAKEDLKPYYTWGYNKYTKDVTTSVRTHSEYYVDGHLVSSDMEQVDTTEYYPLPLADKIETCLADFNFTIKENVLSYSSPYTSGQRNVATSHSQEQIGVDDKNQPIYKTVTYESVTWTETKVEMIEDIEQSVETTINPARFKTFIDLYKIPSSDLYVVQAVFDSNFGEAPPSQDFMEIFTRAVDVLNGYEDSGAGGGIISGNDGGGGISGPITPSEIVGKIPLFLQYDSRWGSKNYAITSYVQTIAETGCGPSSFAMIATGLGAVNPSMDLNKDGVLDPYESCQYSLANGFRTVDQGTYWSFFASIGKKSGLKVKQVGKNQYSEVVAALQQGNPVIGTFGFGHFTSGGHFVAFAGVDQSGKLIVRDPNYGGSASKIESRWRRWGVPYTQQQVQDFVNHLVEPNLAFSECKQWWIFSK